MNGKKAKMLRKLNRENTKDKMLYNQLSRSDKGKISALYNHKADLITRVKTDQQQQQELARDIVDKMKQQKYVVDKSS